MYALMISLILSMNEMLKYLSKTRDFKILFDNLDHDSLKDIENKIAEYEESFIDECGCHVPAICWYEGNITTDDLIEIYKGR